MTKLCECGCGKPAPIAKANHRLYGHIKGEPVRFVVGHARRGRGTGRSASHGYVRVVVERGVGGRVRGEHVLVAEGVFGKPLPKQAVVHHVDENRANNVPSNLVVCQDQAYHKLIHRRTVAYRATGDANARRCVLCHRWSGPADVRIRAAGRVVHSACEAAYRFLAIRGLRYGQIVPALRDSGDPTAVRAALVSKWALQL